MATAWSAPQESEAVRNGDYQNSNEINPHHDCGTSARALELAQATAEHDGEENQCRGVQVKQEQS
jgi:hypothetical protein